MSGEDLELRVIVPRAAIESGARAEYFSQHNAPALLGMPSRQFLELLRRDDAPPVTRIGKLRLVEREPLLAFLRAQRRTAPAAPPAQDLDGPDAVLAEIGCVPSRVRRVG